MLFASSPSLLENFVQFTVLGLTYGCLFALIALGYTMVYGIVELINFAHGDLFMLGGFVSLTVVGFFGLTEAGAVAAAGPLAIGGAILVAFVGSVLFCSGLNTVIDIAVYRPLRNAPKLAPLVSAIGVSFILMNAGLFWGGSQPVSFPDLLPNENLLERFAQNGQLFGTFGVEHVRFTAKNLLVFGVTVPAMLGLTLFIKYSKLGKAMRAVAQNPTAAKLMGIDTDRIIGLTFAIGGALAGAAAVIYGLTIGTVKYDMGYQNGLYAFTAAVLGGIGRLPGAVLGGLIIGLVSAYGSAYIGERWNGALIFGILIMILIFRPTGLLGSTAREKV